jgi:cytochrome c oxidase subunit 2
MRLIVFFISIFLSSNAFGALGKPEPWQLDFQEAATPVMEQLHYFHNLLLVIIFSIVAIVCSVLFYILYRFNSKRNPVPNRFAHNVKLEVFWTLIPVVILVIIAIPSLRILKFAETIPDHELTVKVVGYQWYWGYTYPDNGNFSFDSNIIQDKDLQPGDLRLLEVDNKIVIPVNTKVRFLITAADVVHSFAVPSFGVKTDAIPGRVNHTWVRVTKPGVYYGQCSELCGVGHGFMPIKVEVVSKEEFEKWVEESKQKFASTPSSIMFAKN